MSPDEEVVLLSQLAVQLVAHSEMSAVAAVDVAARILRAARETVKKELES